MEIALLAGIATPLFFSFLISLMSSKRTELFFPISVLGSTIPIATSVYLLMFGKIEGSFNNVLEIAWIKPYGINWFIGYDGISLVMILLTTLLVPLALLSSSSSLRRSKGFLISILVLESAVMGVFTSADLLTFFLFFEAILIPMYFIIGVWGGDNRKYATIKFILYTVFGSIFMFAGIIITGLLVFQQFGYLAFDFQTVSALVLSLPQQKTLFLLFTFAFAVKVPIFPFHTWLPDAHVEAPTAGSILLAGVLLKLGAYGLIRISVPFFTDAFLEYREHIALLGVVGIIYGAVVAIPQNDIKKLVAYSSVSHMGFIVLGIASGTVIGMQGAVFQMINHGITTGALFMLVGFLYDRRHTRNMSEFGGVKTVMPLYASTFLIASLASIGLPGFNGFVGEFMILIGSYETYNIYTAISALGVVFAAIYMLWAYQKIFTGEIREEKNKNLSDLNLREKLSITPLLLLMIIIGVYPYLIEQFINFDVLHIAKIIQISISGAS